MASYYTYGAVPTVEDTVFGPLFSGYADGGEVDDLIPQAPPEDLMRGVSGPEMFRWSDGTYHFRPEESGQRTPIDQLPDYYRRLTEEALAKSPLESSPGPGLGGDEPVYTPRGEDVPVAPLESLPGPGLAGDDGRLPRGEDVPVAPLSAPTSSGAAPSNWLENMKQFTGGATPSPLAYLSTKGTGGANIQEGTPQKTLSDLLKANKFEEAFKFAEANNLQQLLAVPAYLRDLRDPFTKEEAQQFLNAAPANFLPNLSGTGDLEKFTFDPRGAAERGAFGWMGFDEKGQPIASETGFPRLDAAWKVEELDPKTSIFEKIFKAAALAATVAGGAQALGALGKTAGATAAGGAGAGAGAAGTGAATTFSPGLAASQMAATGTYGSGLAGLGAAGAAGAAGTGAGLGAGTTAAAAPLQTFTVTAPAAKGIGSLAALGPGSLASLNLMRGVSDIPVDIYGRPVEPPPAEAPPKAPPEEPLKEILVTAPKPISALDIAAGATVPALSKTIADMGYRAPAFEGTPIEDIPEVVVQGTAPKPIDLTSVVGPLTAAQLTQGFTQPQVDPTTGELKEPPKTQQELDAIEEALKTGKPIPGAASVVDKIKDAYDTYKKIRQISSLLGGLGAAAAGDKKPVATAAAPSTVLGGALPKYTYTRQQLSPDIDYYTYGTRPEAKFFEQGLKLEQPQQTEPPQGPPSKPPGDEPVFAAGGLTGYAKGGSNKSRYVAGPGSGRDDKIPALLSDGEYVMDAETLALLGDGSTKEGARKMDKFRAKIRKHKGRALSRGRISPNAKSPDKYMGGGLT